MGLLDRVDAELSADPPPEPDAIDAAFWAACHGGQLATAQRLLAAGADLSWVAPWDGLTPLDAARRSAADGVATWQEVADWLVAQGTQPASERR